MGELNAWCTCSRQAKGRRTPLQYPARRTTAHGTQPNPTAPGYRVVAFSLFISCFGLHASSSFLHRSFLILFPPISHLASFTPHPSSFTFQPSSLILHASYPHPSSFTPFPFPFSFFPFPLSLVFSPSSFIPRESSIITPGSPPPAFHPCRQTPNTGDGRVWYLVYTLVRYFPLPARH